MLILENTFGTVVPKLVSSVHLQNVTEEQNKMDLIFLLFNGCYEKC